MHSDTKASLKELWKHEIATRKEAQSWNALSNAGFIGLVATEIPEFIAKEKGGKRLWRAPLFFASSASIAVGVIMNLFRSRTADAIRESALMIEHSHECKPPSANSMQWCEKSTAQHDSAQLISK